QAQTSGAGADRRPSWPPGRDSPGTTRTPAAADRARACRGAASATSTTGPGRDSRTARTRRAPARCPGSRDSRPRAGRSARGGHHVGDDVARRAVLDVLRRVEAQPVEMEFLDPVARVLHEELARRRRPLEIQRPPPVVLVLVGEVVARELFEVVA